MKVAINVSRESLGGITTSNLNLIKHLYRNNHEVTGIELNARRQMKGAFLYRQFDPSLFDHNIINIHELHIGEIIKKSKNIKEVVAHFREIITLIQNTLKDTKPDVVLVSGTFYIPWLISIAAKKQKIPILLWYSGVLTKETESYPLHTRTIFRQMEIQVIKNASKIIFPSSLCQEAVRTCVTPRLTQDTYVIPNPVSSYFSDSPVVHFPVSQSIAAVGRYTPVKNFDLFFNIHTELLKQKWLHECSIVTNAGKKQIKHLPKSISVLPPMNTEGIKNFYTAQGLIVCPSTFETFGNVPMEAACMGVPVLVNDTMGCSEILKKAGLANMVISFKDMKAVTERIKELCGQSIMPKQLNNLRRILNPDLVHSKITSILESCVLKGRDEKN